MSKKSVIAFILSLLSVGEINAQVRTANLNPAADSRGKVELTICSQNLHNYGSFEDSRSKDPKLTREGHKAHEDALVERFVSAHCDVIAVQELLGKTELESKAALDQLAARLRESTNRVYETRVGPSGEGKLTLGFIVAKDRAQIINQASYHKVELPKLSDKEKPRFFSRGPLEIQIVANSYETKLQKAITLINFHLKSQRGGEGDPTGLEWETFRMEMSEALRRVVERRHSKSFASGESILLLMGDRNSNSDTASAKILEGSVTLESFQGTAPCRLSKRGVPLCKAGETYPQRLFSVLTTNPRTKEVPGTFSYKGIYSWLDEIVMPAESLTYAWITDTSEGQYNSGVVYKPKSASDHALVYVRLNW